MTVYLPEQRKEGISRDQANDILMTYDLGKTVEISRLRSGYANENYRVKTDRDRYLLRVCREKDERDIRHEMKVLDRLKKEGFPAAYPIPGIDGNMITCYDELNVVIYDFIKGEEPQLNVESVGEIGSAVGILNSMKGWEELERRNAFDLELCRENLRRMESGDSVMDYSWIFEQFREETEELSGPLQEDLPRGLIHGDVFPDNTIFQGNRLQAIVDFEEVCTDKLLVEVGVTVNGFCFVNNRLDGTLLRAFLRSYSSEREMSEKERELLPYYIRWGAHAMAAWHLRCLLQEYDPRKLKRLMMFMERVKRFKNHVFD